MSTLSALMDLIGDQEIRIHRLEMLVYGLIVSNITTWLVLIVLH